MLKKLFKRRLPFTVYKNGREYRFKTLAVAYDFMTH